MRALGRLATFPAEVRGKGLKLFWTGEFVDPIMSQCDYAITGSYLDHPRHYRLPYWALRVYRYGVEPSSLLGPRARIEMDVLAKGRPANFLFRHRVALREEFMMRLGTRMKVDAPGVSMNNCKIDVVGTDGKIEFLSNYLFTIAFENAKADGFTTEKVLDPLLGRSIPVYWGNKRVTEEFNYKALVIVDEEADFDRACDFLVELSHDPSRIAEMLAEPVFQNDRLPPTLDTAPHLELFRRVIGDALS